MSIFLKKLKLILIFFLLFFLAGNVYAVSYFSDDFNVSLNTYLSSRIPNVGTSWSRIIDNGNDIYIYSSSKYACVISNGENTGFYIKQIALTVPLIMKFP